MTTPLLPHALRAALPAALPDQRTAERLLDIVDQLARALQQPRPAPNPAAPPDQLLALQTENAQLKARQAAAKARLEALLVKIQTMPADTPESHAA
ncbi:MAG: hypothetical protein INF43_00565 [Alphaproteobacteria bacterium]|jgi:hypothetical protein|nr:hypothetical protein [Alphaproteobacteria bacterium]